MIDPKPATTAVEISGYRISKNLGSVRGIVVRSRRIVGNIGASLQTLFGGNITIYTELCEKARADAHRLMIEHAAQLAANTVIAVRYDANEIADGVTEVLAYGTAVYAEVHRG
ncbi:MAG TPA: YbjQ family protein [Candidatus Binatia bacterium]